MSSAAEGAFSERLSLANSSNGQRSISNRIKNYQQSFYDTETQEKPVKLSSKLQPGKMKGYFSDQNDPLEDFIHLHDEEVKRVSKLMKDNVSVKKKVETVGKGCFDFPANGSEEIEQDYQMLRMRSAIDPKRFYKKPEHKKGTPKFVQMGTVITDPHDFYDRATKAERKSTIVEEMLADIESRRKLKKRFKTVKPMVAKKKRKIVSKRWVK